MVMVFLWALVAITSCFCVAHGDKDLHVTSFEDLLSRQPQENEFDQVDLIEMSSRTIVSNVPQDFHVHLRTQGRELEFDVQLHHQLFDSATHIYAHGGPENELIKLEKPKQIAYAGKLPGNGYVRLTMLDDNKFHATIRLASGEMVVIDPIDHHNERGKRRLESLVSSTGMVSYVTSTDSVQVTSHRKLSEWGRMTQCSWPMKQLTVGVASDAGFTAEHGGADKTQSFLISVYNSINGLYDDQVGVHLTVGTFVIQTSVGGPSWNVAPGTCGNMVLMENQLNALKTWVAGGTAPLCGQSSCGVWHAHTNCDADPQRTGNVAGLAWVGTLCSSTMGYNTGVSIDGGAQTWVIVGHELGHNFGADHTFNEGGIMSYNWNTPMKFYDNGQVCSFVSSILNNKCITEYNPSAETTTPSPTLAPTTATTTTAITTTTKKVTTAVPTTTKTAITPSPTRVTSVPGPTAPTTTSTTTNQDPCDCTRDNLCRQLNRPGCQSFLGKEYCYVVGYELCKRAIPSATCTNSAGKRLYYVEFDDVCKLPSIVDTPETSTSPPDTISPSTASPSTLSPDTTEITTSPPMTTEPTSEPTTAEPSSTPTHTTTSPPDTTGPIFNDNTTALPPATSESDPCSCSLEPKCSMIPNGGCRDFNGKGWCYVSDPRRCYGEKYYNSMDCAGQKYTECDLLTNKTLSTIPNDPCACSSKPKCHGVSIEPGCFKSENSHFCYVENPSKCFGPGVRSSAVCRHQKIRQCASTDVSLTEWVVGEWSKCSKTCGGGVKTRKAVCMDRRQIITFTDTSCTTPKPETSISCNIRSCPTKAFKNTTPCAGPSHSYCKSRRHKHICDCACNKGYMYDRHRRECVALPIAEMDHMRCTECRGNVYGISSFEMRSHNMEELHPTVCNGRVSKDMDVSASWLAAFEPDKSASEMSSNDGADIAMIVVASCIAVVAIVLVVMAYRRQKKLNNSNRVQTPVYVVGATPGAIL